jgi:four helix bundle protein
MTRTFGAEREASMQSYKELIVYQKAYQLSLLVYQVTRIFPKTELFGLVSQMRRSAISIACNIAEGYRRKYRKEYIQFLHVAYGSCSELETLISLSFDLGMTEQETFAKMKDLETEVSKLLRKLILSLSKSEV